MKHVTYYVEEVEQDGEPGWDTLTAHTERGAIRQLGQWLREHDANGTCVYLRWRTDDAQQDGYINPRDGASPVGLPWRRGDGQEG